MKKRSKALGLAAVVLAGMTYFAERANAWSVGIDSVFFTSGPILSDTFEAGLDSEASDGFGPEDLEENPIEDGSLYSDNDGVYLAKDMRLDNLNPGESKEFDWVFDAGGYDGAGSFVWNPTDFPEGYGGILEHYTDDTRTTLLGSEDMLTASTYDFSVIGGANQYGRLVFSAVPEPDADLLLGLGAVGAGIYASRRKKKEEKEE